MTWLVEKSRQVKEIKGLPRVQILEKLSIFREVSGKSHFRVKQFSLVIPLPDGVPIFINRRHSLLDRRLNYTSSTCDSTWIKPNWSFWREVALFCKIHIRNVYPSDFELRFHKIWMLEANTRRRESVGNYSTVQKNVGTPAVSNSNQKMAYHVQHYLINAYDSLMDIPQPALKRIRTLQMSS